MNNDPNQVPVFYREQNDRVDRPLRIVARNEARQMKLAGRGAFENHGRTFRLFQSIPSFWDGVFGVGNLLPFSRVQNPFCKPPRINYPIPACGAHGRFLSVKATNQVEAALPA